MSAQLVGHWLCYIHWQATTLATPRLFGLFRLFPRFYSGHCYLPTDSTCLILLPASLRWNSISLLLVLASDVMYICLASTLTVAKFSHLSSIIVLAEILFFIQISTLSVCPYLCLSYLAPCWNFRYLRLLDDRNVVFLNEFFLEYCSCLFSSICVKLQNPKFCHCLCLVCFLLLFVGFVLCLFWV